MELGVAQARRAPSAKQGGWIFARVECADKKQIAGHESPALGDAIRRSRLRSENRVGGFVDDAKARGVNARDPNRGVSGALRHGEHRVGAPEEALTKPEPQALAAHARAAPGPRDEVVEGDDQTTRSEERRV